MASLIGRLCAFPLGLTVLDWQREVAHWRKHDHSIGLPKPELIHVVKPEIKPKEKVASFLPLLATDWLEDCDRWASNVCFCWWFTCLPRYLVRRKAVSLCVIHNWALLIIFSLASWSSYSFAEAPSIVKMAITDTIDRIASLEVCGASYKRPTLLVPFLTFHAVYSQTESCSKAVENGKGVSSECWWVGLLSNVSPHRVTTTTSELGSEDATSSLVMAAREILVRISLALFGIVNEIGSKKVV